MELKALNEAPPETREYIQDETEVLTEHKLVFTQNSYNQQNSLNCNIEEMLSPMIMKPIRMKKTVIV